MLALTSCSILQYHMVVTCKPHGANPIGTQTSDPKITHGASDPFPHEGWDLGALNNIGTDLYKLSTGSFMIICISLCYDHMIICIGLNIWSRDGAQDQEIKTLQSPQIFPLFEGRDNKTILMYVYVLYIAIHHPCVLHTMCMCVQLLLCCHSICCAL